jgi:endonuclease
MIRDTVKELGGKATISQLKQYFIQNYQDINPINIIYDATMITVNAPSRIHYGGGKQIRRTNTNNQYDCLYKNTDGYYETYDPQKHGVWEIYRDEKGKLSIRPIDESNPEDDEYQHFLPSDNTVLIQTNYSEQENDEIQRNQFALESHLRDYLAKNLSSIKGLPNNLRLFTDDSNRTGIEYRTDIGNIDVLAIDDNKCLYVFELKLGRGSDTAVGQVLRYMGWLKANVHDVPVVYGVLMAAELSEKLCYAASMVPNIFLYEYQMQFTVNAVTKNSTNQ